jgi:hypothetical protein
LPNRVYFRPGRRPESGADVSDSVEAVKALAC